MWDETVHIQEICEMKLCIFSGYVEGNCAYSTDMWDETVHTQRICGMKLYIFSGYVG
jgi:hypothetical protein